MKPLRSTVAAVLLALAVPATPPALADVPTKPAAAGIDLAATQWGLVAIRAAEAWKVTRGEGVTVAVLDTGVDGTHPDLQGRVLAGWSTTEDVAVEEGDDSDSDSHGTHVSAIIAGDADGDGVTGVAPAARIMPVQVLGAGGGSDLTVAKGIDWAVRNGAQVINMSLGGAANVFDKGGDITCDAVARAVDAGVVVVVAAGNSGDYKNPQNRPASCPGALSVAALDENLDKTYFSSFDATVSLSAPGRHIVSAVPTANMFPFANWDGTSMAAPFVSGVAALIRAQHPDWTVAQIVEQLRGSAIDLGAKGVDPETGYGLVDAAVAVGLPARTLAAARDAVRAVTIPQITKAVSDGTDTVVQWEAPVGTKVNSYLLRHVDDSGKVIESTYPATTLSGRIAADAWAGGRLVVIALTDNGQRVSMPAVDVAIEFPVAPSTPQPKIKAATVKWVKEGLQVTFTTTGPRGTIDITFLDWEYALVGDVEVPTTKKTYVFSVAEADELRAHYGQLIIGNEKDRLYIDVKPQYLVSGKVYTAGKGRIAVKGTTINACFSQKVGCQGDLVEIRDAATNKKLAVARVMENLNFSVVFSRKPSVRMVVVINGKYRTPSLIIPTEGVTK